MSIMRFRITPDATGEPYEINAGSRDVLVWERTDRAGRSFGDMAANITMADAFRLAHIACRRQRQDIPELAEFERTFEVDMLPPPKDDEGEQEDPTPAGR